MAIEDNKLNVKVGMNTRGFQRGMKTVQDGFKKLNGAIGAFTAGFVGTQVFGVVKGLATMAGEAEKTELRFKRVFGNMSTSVSVFSSKLATDLGRVETDVKSGMVSFQAFFQGLGFGGKEAAGMSAKMQALTFDLASFFNIQDENAQKRFLAALAGSPEVLDQFGINLKQAALQVELYNMGITSTVQNTDELTKTQGRLNIIMRAMQSNGILGDAQRTMNTWDNTVKRTWASLKTLGIAIGNMLLPVLKGFLNAVMAITGGINTLLGLDQDEIDLNKEKKREYEQLTRILLRTNKGDQARILILEQLNRLYPDFWNNIDTTKLSHEQLEKAIISSTKAFDEQENILVQKKGIKQQSKLVNQLKEDLMNLKKANDEAKPKPIRLPKGATTGLGSDVSMLPAETNEQFDKRIKESREKAIKLDKKLQEEINRLTIAEEVFAASVGMTTKEYAQMFRLYSEGTKKIDADAADAAEAEKQRQKDLFDQIKRRHDLLKFINSIQRENSEKLRELHAPLEATYNFYQDLVDAGLDFNTELGHTVDKLNALEEQIAKMDLFVEIKTGFKIPDLGGARDTVEENAENLVNVLRPFTDAAADLWMAILTPKDSTISHAEQKEQTEMMFAGVFQGLGQALFSVGMGIVLFNKGLATMGTPAGIAMMVAGSGLIALGKSKAQKVKSSAHARDAGGGANSGSGTGNFTGMINAIQGEQVFRLAGNDLVTAINRTNTFQGSIGG
jgi:hypothetical protein